MKLGTELNCHPVYLIYQLHYAQSNICLILVTKNMPKVSLITFSDLKHEFV